MSEFDPNKVNTEYRDNVTYLEPVEERKYTVTHSDSTGEIFVTIGTKYAMDKIDYSNRDEVLLQLNRLEDKHIFYGEVLIDGGGVTKNSSIRNYIFITEMPMALKAIRYGDRRFFELHDQLDKSSIYIHFKSTDSKYNKLRYFGNMGMYKN